MKRETSLEEEELIANFVESVSDDLRQAAAEVDLAWRKFNRLRMLARNVTIAEKFDIPQKKSF